MIDLHINYWHYALEIENAGSIRKAAENLYMGQPNLSRAFGIRRKLRIRILKDLLKSNALQKKGRISHQC